MLHEGQMWTRILWEASAQLALKSIRGQCRACLTRQEARI